MEPTRVSPVDIYQNVKSGKTLLVCGYDDDQKFKMMRLEGAISLNDHRSRLSALSKNQDVVFYCA
jgi:hypothetical protein